MADYWIRQPVLVGCGIQTALGNFNATWDGLMAAESGLNPISLPEVTETYHAGQVIGLSDGFGSADRLAVLLRMGLAEIDFLPDISSYSDIIVATTKGAVDELLINPEAQKGQPWQIGELAAGIIGCKSEVQTVSAACASGTVALIQAAQRVLSGVSDVVIVVGIDLISRFVLAGFDALKALSTMPCRPFDKHRDGLSLGEGIGVIIVTGEAFARKHGLDILARINGWGISCDATHITAPCRRGSGLQRIIKQATNNCNVPIGAINAHGTGTRYNDAMELSAFHACWSEKIPPVHSVKGSIGHCLGAAGVIEAAIAVRSLQQGIIPPTVGLDESEEHLACLSGHTSQQLKHSAILSCNSGFGGINAGIVLGKSVGVKRQSYL